MAKKRQLGHQRIVTVSMVLPVTVDLLVETCEDFIDDETDWEIAEVRRAHCEAYPQMVREQMDDETYDDMRAKAAKAEDV